MKRLVLALSVAAVATLGAAATVAAADPTPAPTTAPATVPATGPASNPNRGVMLPAMLNLTHEEVMALRQQGLTLAQIAERQDVDPQLLIDALAAQWTARIDERAALGLLTADQVTALKAEVAVRAKAMVNQQPLGGMRGAAVGAGPGTGAGQGQGGVNRAQGAGGGIHAPGTGGAVGLGGGNGYRGGRGATVTPTP